MAAIVAQQLRPKPTSGKQPARIRVLGVELQRSTPLHLPPHPDRLATENWREWALRQTLPKAVDLFAGGGGLSLGLEQAGYRVILAVDHDPWSLETLRHNFSGAAIGLDLADPEAVSSLLQLLAGIPLDIIAGGPPCQPFSRAGRSKIRSLVKDGKRDAVDKRRELWHSFLRVVEELRPAAVLFENVPDMALGDDLVTLRRLLGRLETAGYEADARLVEAWKHGVPQHRQRLFVLATRNGQRVVWPKRRSRQSVKTAIGDLPRLRTGTGDVEMEYRGAQTAFQRRARQGMPFRSTVVWDHVTRPVRDDDRRAFRLMRPGTLYSALPVELRRYRDDIFDDKYNRLAWDELSRSITAHISKDGYWYIHPSEARTLTVREAARIQTFPDRYRFAGTRSHAFSQIGNAVPPLLAEAVAVALLDATRRPPVKERDTSRARLALIRARLLGWASEQARLATWRHPVEPWAVVLGAVLESRDAPSSDKMIRSALGVFQSPSAVTSQAVRAFARPFDLRERRRLDQLGRAGRALAAGDRAWKDDQWMKLAGLGPSQKKFIRAVGLRADTVLLTNRSLRVVGRVLGSDIYARNRGSDGQMMLGRVVGTGPDIPAINAALAALGLLICLPQRPKCTICPLKNACVSAQIK